MNIENFFGVRRTAAVLLVINAVLLAGCSSSFHHHLVESTRAINAGDLDRARHELGRARIDASDEIRQEKVESLDRLIAGTDAFMHGEIERARVEWSLIPDPQLRHQVRIKARTLGIDLAPEHARLNGRMP